MISTKTDLPVRVNAAALLTAWAKVYMGAVILADPLAQLKRASGLGGGWARSSLAAFSYAIYVETTPGYLVAKPVLIGFEAKGQPFGAIKFRRPGESLPDAVGRLRWGESFEPGMGEADLLERVYLDFHAKLRKRIEDDPPAFVDYRVCDEDDGGAVTAGEREQLRLWQGIESAYKRQDQRGFNRIAKALTELHRRARSGAKWEGA
jgi:hypothetical protein